MSGKTTADYRIDSAKEHIKSATEDLHKVVTEKCWGWKDYGPEYQANLKKVLIELIQIEDKL